MKRMVSALVLVALVAFLWVSAATAAGPYIEDITLGDIHGPKIGTSYRDGLITGVFLAIMSSKSVSCPMLSANMLKAGLESALQANEITPDWTIYHASLYVMVRAGCSRAATEKPNG